MRGAKRQRELWKAQAVRRRRRLAATLRFALSTQPGAQNRSEGGSTLEQGGPALVSSWYDGSSPGASIVVTGRVSGAYGNNSVFGPGPRVLRQGDLIFGIAGSAGSGGLR